MLLTKDEVKERIRAKCRRTVDRLIQSGKLRALQVGGRVLVPEEDLAEFLTRSVKEHAAG